METKKILAILFLALALIVCVANVSEAAPMGTAFTYQGRLIDANEVADGLYDFQFRLYGSASYSNQVGSDVNVPDMDVIDGYFTVLMDFNDVNSFDGEARWLEIGVRPGDQNDPCAYTALVPRQELTPVPYALRAESVSTPLELVAAAPAGTAVLGVMNTGDGAVAIGAQGTNGDIGALGTPDAGVTGLGITGLAGYFSGDVWVTGEYRDSSNWAGVSGEVLTSTGTGTLWGAMDWTNLANIPVDIADGDDDTQLSEGAVDSYVANNGYVSFWGDIPDIPADFADGTDDIGGPDSDWMISGSDMYSIPSGNVGIGTTSPSEVLDVNGNINIDSVYKIGGATILSNAGPNNIFVGADSGVSITTGYSNSAIGYEALYSNTEGFCNSAVGHYALYSNTTGNDNTAMGYQALWNNTGNNNSALGRGALRSNTTGNNNSAVGLLTLRSNTEGSYNSALGRDALIRNTTGNYNVGVGGQANSYNQEGSKNTIIGYEAGRGTTYHNKSGNVFLGYKAGYSETGDNKLYIANDVADANVLIYGDFSAGQVGIGTTSPQNALDVEGAVAVGAAYAGTNAGPTNGMVIEGNVGIGTTNPLAKLSVGGDGLGETGVFGSGAGRGVFGYSYDGIANIGVYAYGGSTSSNDAHGLVSIVARDGSGDYYSGSFGDSGAGGTYWGLNADLRTGAAIDIAEYILDTKGDTEPGDVLAADPDNDESVIKSSVPYDSAVVGIVSTQPHLLMGMELVRDEETGEMYEDVSVVKLALAGRVPVKVTDENGPIERGDMLTTSSKPGYAMKWSLLDVGQAEDFGELKSMLAENETRRNAVVGKALGNLDSGDGKIMALVSLQ